MLVFRAAWPGLRSQQKGLGLRFRAAFPGLRSWQKGLDLRA